MSGHEVIVPTPHALIDLERAVHDVRAAPFHSDVL